MAQEFKDNEKPVFLINGFLESGKSSFINFTISEEYFHIDEKTLLIVTEEGEVSYDDKLLKKENIKKVVLDDQEQMTKENLEELSKDCDRIVIEFNGMWNPDTLRFPEEWVLYQQITIFNGETMDMYLNNMKALMGPMLRYTELVLINRCDGIPQDKLQNWKRALRPMLMTGAEIVMESRYGEIPLDTIAEDLPYDVSGSNIVINPENYGIWFFDCRDYIDRYTGKTVEIDAAIMMNDKFGPNEFVPGRMAMTCCEADMSFLGFIAKYEKLNEFEEGDFVHIKAKVARVNRKEYQGEGPYLKVIEMTKREEIKDPVTF
ncbi:MAG: GTP-binding protein [Eubacteriales bacterium]|nr:GTP-binding protein [Eubacteriales bacterium]